MSKEVRPEENDEVNRDFNFILGKVRDKKGSLVVDRRRIAILLNILKPYFTDFETYVYFQLRIKKSLGIGEGEIIRNLGIHRKIIDTTERLFDLIEENYEELYINTHNYLLGRIEQEEKRRVEGSPKDQEWLDNHKAIIKKLMDAIEDLEKNRYRSPPMQSKKALDVAWVDWKAKIDTIVQSKYLPCDDIPQWLDSLLWAKLQRKNATFASQTSVGPLSSDYMSRLSQMKASSWKSGPRTIYNLDGYKFSFAKPCKLEDIKRNDNGSYSVDMYRGDAWNLVGPIETMSIGHIFFLLEQMAHGMGIRKNQTIDLDFLKNIEKNTQNEKLLKILLQWFDWFFSLEYPILVWKSHGTFAADVTYYVLDTNYYTLQKTTNLGNSITILLQE